MDSFFEKYKSSPESAVDFRFATKRLIPPSDSQIAHLKRKLLAAVYLLGRYTGEEFITRKSVANRFMACSHMIKYEREPLRFTFIFYKPASDCFLKFHFDDQLPEELEEYGKAYLLNRKHPATHVEAMDRLRGGFASVCYCFKRTARTFYSG